MLHITQSSTEMKAIYVGFSLCMLFLVLCTMLEKKSTEIHGQSIIYFPYLKSRFFEHLEKCVKVLIFFFEAVWPNERFFGHESIILDADASQCLKKVSERAILIFMCPDRDTCIRYLQNFRPVIAQKSPNYLTRR